MSDDSDEAWFDDYADGEDESQIDEYDITSSPNDFNVLTLFSFVESGAVKIPGFQRNFVWDRHRSSKLIESLIIGIPVPQLFLYEQARNSFLVIDGQQRLMSIYYFLKRRFPKKEKRTELRIIFDEQGGFPEHIMQDNAYFEEFSLQLPGSLPKHTNKFNGLNYATLNDYRTQLDLRPIRNIVVKQNGPAGDDSSIYEVFNRLNTGGVNLRPQEIRTSMYHSAFYDMLYRLNQHTRWRGLLGSDIPDLHMKDIEILLRGFAMLVSGSEYAPSMVRFLNQFSRKSEANTPAQNEYLEKFFLSFLEACEDLSEDAFINDRNNRFNLALFEAAFTATGANAFADRRLIEGRLNPEAVVALSTDQRFVTAAVEGTTNTANVAIRLARAKELIPAL
jgi:uncharacterized protein with ParB-like and HNH nuclease domain